MKFYIENRDTEDFTTVTAEKLTNAVAIARTIEKSGRISVSLVVNDEGVSKASDTYVAWFRDGGQPTFASDRAENF
jgi:hypothetical protein